MLKNAIKMNLEDLWPFLAVEGGFFLLYEIIEAIILFVGKPDTSGAIAGLIVLAMGIMMNLFVGGCYPVLNMDMLLRYSVTRKTALFATLGTMTLNMAVSMTFAALLGWVDHFIAQAYVNALPWVVGVESVEPPLWAYFVVGLGVVCLAFGAGAVLQKFGRKAFWVLWGAWMLLIVGFNIVDWHVLDTLNVPMMAVAAGAACLVSLLGGSWLMLRTSVKN